VRPRPLAGTIATTIAATAFVALGTAAAATAATGLPDRKADPIVLKGADTPALLGMQPDAVVAFAYDGKWRQVPVQVDERAVVDYPTIRQFNQTSGRPFTHEGYTDAGTFAGPDPDPTVDDGDEIAMMAKDAGDDAAELASPAGVAESTRTAVAVSDPLDSGTTRFIYLFRTNAGLDPAAGKSYVDYDFSLNSGDYKTTYDFTHPDDSSTSGPPHNPENSTVTTSHYSERLLARWIADELRLKTGNAPNADILDGDKAQVSRGCGRYEGTFSRGGGGFIANKSGAVRAIRSYIGANSGTYTQRDDIFYERRQDTNTYLRVHAGIGQISQFMDYSANAIGMTYRNSAYPAGVTIDGVPDAGIPTPAGSDLQPQSDWEQVTGPQGSLSTVSRLDTDIPGFQVGSFYRDLGAGPFTNFSQCAGYDDGLVYGASGNEYKSSGPNTDPTLDGSYPSYGHYNLTSSRSIYFDAPDAGATVAALRSAQVDSPLTVTSTAQEGPRPPVLKLGIKGQKRSLKPGGSHKVRVTVQNKGVVTATGIKVCAKAPKRLATGSCKGTDSLLSGKRFKTSLKVSATDRPRHFVKVAYKVTADNARPDKIKAKTPIKH
jgi:hypothetical protein